MCMHMQCETSSWQLQQEGRGRQWQQHVYARALRGIVMWCIVAAEGVHWEALACMWAVLISCRNHPHLHLGSCDGRNVWQRGSSMQRAYRHFVHALTRAIYWSAASSVRRAVEGAQWTPHAAGSLKHDNLQLGLRARLRSHSGITVFLASAGILAPSAIEHRCWRRACMCFAGNLYLMLMLPATCVCVCHTCICVQQASTLQV